MRAKLKVLVAVVVLSSCVTGESRPVPAPPAELTGRSDAGARVWLDARTSEIVFVAGPFHIPVFDGTHGPEAGAGAEGGHAPGGHGHGESGREVAAGHEGHQRTPVLEFRWPETGWFQGFKLTVFDDRGNRLDRELLHHLIAVNFERRQLVYPVAERLFGIGQETGDIVLPDQVGVPLEAGTRMGIYASWRNETGEDLHGVYVRIAMPFTPQSPDARVESVFPFYVDTNNRIGDTNAWDLPPGHAERSYEFEIPLDGSLLVASGHLHDHGKELRLEDARREEVLFTLQGIEADPGELQAVETRVFRKLFGLIDGRVPLAAGRPYRVVGVYENTTGRVLELGAMAHIVGLFAPDDPEAWPEADPRSVAWLEDIAALGNGETEVVGGGP